MSPFQISRRPIEDNYNLGDTEEHYSSKPFLPLRPAVFPLQFKTLLLTLQLFLHMKQHMKGTGHLPKNEKNKLMTKNSVISELFLCLTQGKSGTATKIFLKVHKVSPVQYNPTVL